MSFYMDSKAEKEKKPDLRYVNDTVRRLSFRQQPMALRLNDVIEKRYTLTTAPPQFVLALSRVEAANKDFYAAIDAGDLKEVHAMLSRAPLYHPDLNAVNDHYTDENRNGETPLMRAMMACRQPHPGETAEKRVERLHIVRAILLAYPTKHLVDYLLQADGFKQTALWMASEHGPDDALWKTVKGTALEINKSTHVPYLLINLRQAEEVVHNRHILFENVTDRQDRELVPSEKGVQGGIIDEL